MTAFGGIKSLFFLALFQTLLMGQALTQSLYFPPIQGGNWDTLSPASLNWCPELIDSLYKKLEADDTRAFIVLVDGKIVLEKYFHGHEVSTPWYWASAGKSLTAFMVGLAQQQGLLSIHDSSSKYLGQGWTTCTPEQERAITIRHQLTMTTGLDDRVADIHCTDDTCLKYLVDPNTRWSYHNAPYTLLDGVLESATGKTLNLYVQQNLTAKTGITGLYFKSGYNNVFGSTARSMARFGLLMLNEGVWDGDTIMSDSVYFNDMINTSQTFNRSYGYLWWLNGKGSCMLPGFPMVINRSLFLSAPSDAYAALGKNGQILNVVPSKNMVIVRMGESPSSVDVPYLLNDEIWEYINRLPCNAQKTVGLDNTIRVYPNPGRQSIRVDSQMDLQKVRIYTASGETVMIQNKEGSQMDLNVDFLEVGLYFIEVEFLDGSKRTLKWMKN